MAMASPDDRSVHAHQSGDKSVTPNASHTRTYQACIPCRRRKVRCDLGPVDHPHEPPCVRCRREAKECYFSATRRKKRAADSGAGLEEVEVDDYEVRGGRKRLKDGRTEGGSDFGSFDAAAAATAAGPSSNSPAYIAQPLTPGGSVGRHQPLRRPDQSSLHGSYGDSENEEQVNNHTAAILQTAELHHGHDALKVLLAAAQQDSKPTGSFDHYAQSIVSPVTGPHASPEQQRVKPMSKQSTMNIDPSIMPADEQETAAAVQAWSRFRFVRNGWFSAQEGIKYIDYFYTYLCPLTPICVPDYRRPAMHRELLENEPLLAVTILMIASRYTPLSKASLGRSSALHQRLWNYTQSMIDRVLWGRELPGVYASSLHGDAGCDVNPLSRRGLLTLGSVESLMLLTEWHSRHVHFPSDGDDAELMAPDPADGDSYNGNNEKSGIKAWIEPCFRSDRMCWKLLNIAMSVAMEIGVFDTDTTRHAKIMTHEQRATYEQRRLHVKSMLLVYITQTSGRLGITAMLPHGYAVPDLSELFLTTFNFRDIRDVVVHFWLQLARLVQIGNEKLYANRLYTRDIIRSGGYKSLLQEINPQLTKWRQDVDSYRKHIPPQMYHIMMIEYEHSRVCVNQLALQAVVERCINNSAAEGDQGRAIPPDRLNQWYGEDRENVGAVIDACRNVLKIVVNGLAPDGFLTHVPVRTNFRVISVTMVLVKTFAFGANSKEMAISLDLMQRTVTAIRSNVVDDVHISNGFATHMSLLVERVPKALKRFPGSGGASVTGSGQGASRAVSQSPAPQGMYATSSSSIMGGSERGPAGMRGNANGIDNWQSYSSNNSRGSNMNGSSNNDNSRTNSGNGNGNVMTAQPPPHPLDGFDFDDSNNNNNASGDNSFMLMPPPLPPGHSSASSSDYYNYSNDNNNNSNGNTTAFGTLLDGIYASHAGNSGGGGDQGWLALPLDNIFAAQNVQQTGFGPAIDGDDMLEVLLGGNMGA
ncbi:hypothetical protein AAFC00_003267 [Neodothiora populina]|uniref:Zn(2)-C6 fungal-type domain-containing protein n=1 Tax=Neodothiora populina TaxID=2781224 RepID=A0ABR3PAK4_9PEZI